MSSAKKVAANRINGRKGRGPRTRVGKARASRNARRHGLAAFSSTTDPAMPGRMMNLVDAICQGDDNPLLREQAVAIAEAQLWLSCIGTEKVAVLERLRDPRASALTGRNSRRAVAKELSMSMRAYRIAHRQFWEVEALVRETIQAGGDPEREPLPAHLRAIWPPAFLRRRDEDSEERDEYQVLREGIRDLERLLRYEKRALSRRRKAIRAFTAIKMMSR